MERIIKLLTLYILIKFDYMYKKEDLTQSEVEQIEVLKYKLKQELKNEILIKILPY